MIKSNQSVS